MVFGQSVCPHSILFLHPAPSKWGGGALQLPEITFSSEQFAF